MKSRVPYFYLTVVLGVAGLALPGRAADSMDAAPGTAPAPLFFATDTIDWKAVLPAPPAPGSLAGQADLEVVRAVQATRTPAEVAWAKRIDHFWVFDFADVLGPWFTADHLPVTAKFLAAVTAESQAVGDQVKTLYLRPRPPQVDAQLQPCVKIPKTSSYPSGHSTRAFVFAAVLSSLFPDQSEALVAWAHRAAWGRILGGVHFPSDDVGGQLLAKAIVQQLEANPAFRAERDQARAEIAAYLQKKAA